MTDAPDPELHDLLPGASTPLQITLSLVDSRRAYILSGFPKLTTLLSPQDCPAVMLPYLAYQRSVRVWDSAWPEQVKRNVVDAAYEVHRHNGTVKAVKTALAALGVNVRVTEWWQTSPRGFPYTFTVETYASVELYAGESVITPRVARAIRSTIIATKPVTRDFLFEVGALSTGSIGIAGAIMAQRLLRIEPRWLQPEADADLGLIGAFAVRRNVQFQGVQ